VILALVSLLCAAAPPATLRGASGTPLANQNPDSTVLVIPEDGRPAQGIPRVHIGQESYVPLGGLACALGVPFAWNPFSYQGWIATDSTKTTFTLDSPVLIHGNEEAQVASGIAYDVRGVLLPLDYLDLLGDRWHGRRGVTWDPAGGILRWGSMTPAFRQLRISQAGSQTTLKIAMREAPKGASLFWSPVGRLDILLDGIVANPESLTVRGLARGAALLVRDVAGAPGGCRIQLDIGRDALGASAAYSTREGAWELSVTGSQIELAHGGFRGLRQADRSGWALGGGSGPVLLATLVDAATDPVEADSALSDLSERIAQTLADTLMIQVQVAASRDPIVIAQAANANHAKCVIGLRLDRYPSGTGKIQIWSAMPRLRWEPVDLTQSLKELPPRPLLWSETPALHEADSRQLVASLKAHLASLVGGDRIEGGERPSRWLEGLTMPAVLIYPAQADDPLSLEALQDPALRGGLARAIAFAVSEAVAEPGEGSPGGPMRTGPIGIREGLER
jgi:hypothetical protein